MTKQETNALSPQTAPSSSSSSSSSIWSRDYWTGLMDQQRLERLRQCYALNAILKACEHDHHRHTKHQHTKKEKTGSSKDTHQKEGGIPKLDEVGGGIRMLHYYGWRQTQQHMMQQQQHSNSKNSTPAAAAAAATIVHQPGCIPERHAVWACRAIALGCGKELNVMKTCFDDHTAEVLSERKTAYEQADKKDDHNSNSNKRPRAIPCADFQKAVGKCIQESTTGLTQRTGSK